MNNQHTQACSESLYILRLLVLVGLLSHRFQGLCLTGIQEYLTRCRLPVGERQLQRDLHLLSTHFGIVGEADEDNSSRKIWCQKATATWRLAFAPASHGNTDRGHNPFCHDSSSNRAITHSLATKPIRGRILRLIRTLLIVESLPSEDECTWASTKDMVHALRNKGLKVTERTVQRDLKFIREHFLVLTKKEQGRQALWQRVPDGDWQYSFEPRFPRENLAAYSAVRNFFYRNPQPGRWLH